MNWNECQTNDPAAAAAFYEAVLRGRGEGVPDRRGPRRRYHVIQVDGTGRRRDLRDQRVHGRRAAELVDGLQPSPITTRRVAKAKELGGTALMEGMDMPEIGRLAVLQDPTGAVFQVLQPPPES